MMSAELASRLEDLQPEATKELKTINQMALDVSDEDLLLLCLDYARAALLCRDWQPPDRGLSEQEDAFIRFTESYVTSVSTLPRDAVLKLLDYATADEVYAFVHALYVAEMQLRLEIVSREVLL